MQQTTFHPWYIKRGWFISWECRSQHADHQATLSLADHPKIFLLCATSQLSILYTPRAARTRSATGDKTRTRIYSQIHVAAALAVMWRRSHKKKRPAFSIFHQFFRYKFLYHAAFFTNMHLLSYLWKFIDVCWKLKQFHHVMCKVGWSLHTCVIKLRRAGI